MELRHVFSIYLALLLQETTKCCPEYMMNNSTTTGHRFQTDGFPNIKYPSNAKDCWLFWNPDGGIRLEFKQMNTEECCDKVTIYELDSPSDEGTKVDELSGIRVRPDIYNYRGKIVKVEFTTDVSLTARGWQACACPRASTVHCSCEWTAVTEDDSWSAWTSDSGDELFQSSTALETIITGVMSVFILTIILVIYFVRRRVARRMQSSGGATTTIVHGAGTAMVPVDTSNVPPGAYPVQQGVGMYPVQQVVTYTPAPTYSPQGAYQGYAPPQPVGVPPPTYSDAMVYSASPLDSKSPPPQ